MVTPSLQADDVQSAKQADEQAAAAAETRKFLSTLSPDVLAEALAAKLAIAPNDWHRLSSNRTVRAQEQAAAALVYLLKDSPEEALPRLAQAVGWLDKTIKAPPCPTHGERKEKRTSKNL
ncbi:MAG: DUF6439 family protein [Cyanobacteria bacterium J06623_4]